MRFFDRDSDFSRAGPFESHLQRILHNRRIFSEDQSDPPYVTEAVKYDHRPKFEPLYVDDDLPSFSSEVQESTFQHDTPYRFQQRSWEAINNAIENGHQGVLLTAPTGQGKTDAFTAPLLKHLCDTPEFDQVLFVYPRTALLQDQFSRLLESLHQLKQDDEDLSLGAWYGATARNKRDVTDEARLVNQRNNHFQLSNCWDTDDSGSDPLYLHENESGYEITCSNSDHNHGFTNDEIILYREGIRSKEPNIIVTTLESLELFSIKPNYDIIQNIDAIVFDEVHLYRGLYGAHALNVIENIGRVREYDSLEMPLLIGSSATLANPRTFGKQLFRADDGDGIMVVRAREEANGAVPPDMAESNGTEHLQFLKTAPEVGVSSQFIQQSMLYGHRILPNESENAKMLSFIDSLNQINQRHGQLVDADNNQALWRYHETRSDRPWINLQSGEAWDTGVSEFVSRGLAIDKAHSNARVQPDDLATTDLVLASPLLEVGIDLPAIRAVAQYRPPWNASSFIQRIGRAGRKPDKDSYIMMFLADKPNDNNLFYRASRFLETEIRTPLNENNPIVSEIHDKYWNFYKTASRLDLSRDDDQVFLDEYLNQELGYNKLYDFIFDPASSIGDILDRSIGRVSGNLIQWETFNNVSERLEEIHEDIRDDLNIDSDTGVIQKSDAFDEINDSIDHIIGQYADLLSSIPSENKHLNDAEKALNTARDKYSEADEKPLSEPDKKTKKYRESVSSLQKIRGSLTLISDIGRQARREARSLDNQIFETVEKIDDLKANIDNDRFDELLEQSRIVYNLRKAIEEFGTYREIPYAFWSLFAVKGLLRCAYHFDRALQVNDDSNTTLDNYMYHVPQNYFGNSAVSVTIIKGSETVDEDRTVLFSQYAPYRANYADRGKKMHIIAPDFDPNAERKEFDFKSIAKGRTKSGVFEPESIKATVVKDQSGRRTQGIIQYCPVCYDLLTESDMCSKHNKKRFGKIHSTPHVTTKFRPAMGDDQESNNQPFGDITIRHGQGQIALDSVDLEITPAIYIGDRYIMRYEQQRQMTIYSRDQKLGVTLPTKGIELDIHELLEEVRHDVGGWETLIIGERESEAVDVAAHTAAHLLLVLVADIAGINPRNLHYGIRKQEPSEDVAPDSVYVFEEAEGGQGIVDLLGEELARGDSDCRLLDSIERVAFNEQLEAERFCSDLQRVRTITPEEGNIDGEVIENSVEDYLVDRPIANENRLKEELRNIVLKIIRVSEDTSLERSDVMEIKTKLVQARLNGLSEENAIEEVNGIPAENEDLIETDLCPPDIDSCVNNLQFSGCRAEDQNDVLSYELLTELVRRFTGNATDRGEISELFGYDF